VTKSAYQRFSSGSSRVCLGFCPISLTQLASSEIAAQIFKLPARHCPPPGVGSIPYLRQSASPVEGINPSTPVGNEKTPTRVVLPRTTYLRPVDDDQRYDWNRHVVRRESNRGPDRRTHQTLYRHSARRTGIADEGTCHATTPEQGSPPDITGDETRATASAVERSQQSCHGVMSPDNEAARTLRHDRTLQRCIATGETEKMLRNCWDGC
jgi:hypothetical protein